VISAEPFLHGQGTLWCLQKEMATYRHWSVSSWRDPDDVPHCWILSLDKTEWWLISATLCGWRCCLVADQFWFMTHIREEEERVRDMLELWVSKGLFAKSVYTIWLIGHGSNSVVKNTTQKCLQPSCLSGLLCRWGCAKNHDFWSVSQSYIISKIKRWIRSLGTCIRSIERCHFQWSWTTVTTDQDFSISISPCRMSEKY